jgi:polyisoprenoid-binding protein YceI
MAIYRIGAGSRLTVKARSRVHDTTTVWSSLSGEVAADPATIATPGAAVSVAVAVDMTAFDAGDFLKNRKLRKDFDLEAHPKATFELVGLGEVTKDGAKLTAKARGTLRWRGREVPLEITGTGVLDEKTLDVHGSFDLDIRQLGLAAPRFLMFKMEDEVTVDVVLKGAGA